MKEIEAWNGPFLRNDLRICFILGHHSCVDPSTPTLSRSRVRIHTEHNQDLFLQVY